MEEGGEGGRGRGRKREEGGERGRRRRGREDEKGEEEGRKGGVAGGLQGKGVKHIGRRTGHAKRACC